MSTGGYGSGGASGAGPSEVYMSLPWKGWRETASWIEEFVDACGYRFDVLKTRFLSAAARANLLDPTYTPVESASTYLATATAPAINNTSTDSMLDVLLFIALGLYPVDSNLSVSQRQALTQIGWDALKRKGTRLQLLNLVSQLTGGVVTGWTLPPYQFNLILPDGAPSPGYGSTWVQSSSTIANAVRPWIMGAAAQVLGPVAPAWDAIGIGYSQFRAGYSAAGEAVFNTGTRIGILPNSSFANWTAGVPDSWTKDGTGTLTQATSATYINWEFTGSAARFDLTAAASGTFVALYQTTAINNQATHRVEIDYAYSNTQNVNTLAVYILDANADGTTYSWDVAAGAWSTSSVKNVLPVSSSRTRFATDVVPQANSSIDTRFGTQNITVKVIASSDGTSTTQGTYDIYRFNVFEKFDLDQETAAGGERTLWAPLVDALGWTTSSRGAGGSIIEPANYDRSSYKVVSGTAQDFPYHPAFSGRGMRATQGWTNLLKGSNDFGVDWTATCFVTSNAEISPIIGEVSPTAVRLTAFSGSANILQDTGVTPTNKKYIAGVWVKKLSADTGPSSFTDVTLSLVSTSTVSQAYTLTQNQGWQLLVIQGVFSGSDIANLKFKIGWGAAIANGSVAVSDAYVYDVTSRAPALGNVGILYPPVVRTSVGATASISASKVVATTLSTGTNVLHPLLQRALASPTKGILELTVVPAFDPGLAVDGVIFDIAQDATHNRVKLWYETSSNSLKLSRWDNSANTWSAFLGLTASPNPSLGSATWHRDTPITIRCLWDDNSTLISAGNGNAQGTKPGSWSVSESSVSIGIGNDYNKANQFEGLIRLDPGVIQLGAFIG